MRKKKSALPINNAQHRRGTVIALVALWQGRNIAQSIRIVASSGATEMSDKMREEFEKWTKTHYVLKELSVDLEDGEYIEPDMQYAYESWGASRAAIILPRPIEVEVVGVGCTFQNEYLDADEVIAAIGAGNA